MAWQVPGIVLAGAGRREVRRLPAGAPVSAGPAVAGNASRPGSPRGQQPAPMSRPVAGGLTVGDFVSREVLQDRLRQRRDAAPAEAPAPIPVSPQRRRQATRKRLAERTGSVVARILDDLGLSRPGREVAGGGLGTGPGPNAVTVTKLLNQQIREFTGKKRENLTVGETEAAYQELDRFGDAVRDRIREALGRSR